MDHREPRGHYRGRRRVPSAPRARYAAVVTTALVGAGVAALVTSSMLTEASASKLSLADADANADAAAARSAALANDRASRGDARDATTLSADTPAPSVWYLPLNDLTITSKFGPDAAANHGVNLSAKEGTEFHAVATGTVVLARANGVLGLNIVIDHGDGTRSYYAHSQHLLVKEGQHVEAGQPIGTVGTTGYSFGCYLAFDIRVDGQSVDSSLAWLKARGAEPVGQNDARS